MAMVRSALGKISRRLSGSSAVICQAPPLPSLHPAAQLMTTAFSSPAAAAAARVRRIPNLQVSPYIYKKHALIRDSNLVNFVR